MSRRVEGEGPVTGHLGGTSLPELLRELSRFRATGMLHLGRRTVRRVVHVKDGRFIFAGSSDPNDRLGEQLLKAGKISLGQLETALAQQASGKRLGTLLVEAQIITREDLVDSVREQLRSIVFDLMTWTEGEYRFDADVAPADEDIEIDLTLEELLFHGVRGIHALRCIDRGVAPRTIFRLADSWTERVRGLELTEAARALLQRLEAGRVSLEALCREVCGSNFEIQRTLWGLALIGAVEPVARPGGPEGTEGSLAETSVADLLTRFERQGATGVLYLTRGRLERAILFAAGRCVFATSNDPDDGLVHFLYRRGVISLRDREEAGRRLLSNKRVGTILRELGAIDDEDLQQMVRQQVSEIVYDSIGWEEGEFVFVPGPLPHAEEITLHTSAGTLIAEGVRRIGSWTRLLQGCGGVDNPLCLTPSYLTVLDGMEASVAEWEVINALKSPQTPRRVCALVAMNDLRTCQILWTLKLLGAVADSPVDVDEDGEPVAECDLDAPAAAAEPAVAAAPVPPLPDVSEIEAEPVQALDSAESDESWSAPGDVHEALRSIERDRAPAPDAPPVAPADPPAAAERGPQPAVPDDDRRRATPAELSPDIEETIERFNAIHRLVFRAVRAEIGAGAVNFVRSCCAKLGRDPLDGVRLYTDGSWDAGDLKQLIIEQGIDDPWPDYQRVLDQEFISLQPHLGTMRADQLKHEIWEIARAC